eukprot:347246-Chlamydomonas_euryale.AAC.4
MQALRSLLLPPAAPLQPPDAPLQSSHVLPPPQPCGLLPPSPSVLPLRPGARVAVCSSTPVHSGKIEGGGRGGLPRLPGSNGGGGGGSGGGQSIVPLGGRFEGQRTAPGSDDSEPGLGGTLDGDGGVLGGAGSEPRLCGTPGGDGGMIGGDGGVLGGDGSEPRLGGTPGGNDGMLDGDGGQRTMPGADGSGGVHSVHDADGSEGLRGVLVEALMQHLYLSVRVLCCRAVGFENRAVRASDASAVSMVELGFLTWWRLRLNAGLSGCWREPRPVREDELGLVAVAVLIRVEG